MTRFRPFLLTAALALLSTASLEAQARSFVGRLVSREYAISTNCATSNPPAQTLGTGLPLPLPKLPECAFAFPNGSDRSTAPAYSAFTIDFPAVTPIGTMTPNGVSANLEFSQPLTIRLATNVGWSLNPPEGQATGTHRASYSLELDQSTSDLAPCAGANTSNSASGSIALDASCSLRTSSANWDSATQIARISMTSVVGFRFGNANGEYLVRVKANYEFSALGVDHIEVLQTVQTSDNRVPLIAAKPALVRVFPVSSATSGDAVQIRLNVYRGDDLILTQESGTIPAPRGAVTPRDDLRRTANFLLPAALTAAGPVRFETLVRTAGSTGAYSTARTLESAFVPAPNWPDPFGVAQLQLCPGGPADCPSIANLVEGLGLFAALAPPFRYSNVTATSTSLTEDSAQAFLKLFQLRYAIESQSPAAELYLATDGRDPANTTAESDPLSPAGAKKLAYLSGDASVTLPCLIGANLGLPREESTIGDPGLSPTLDSLIAASSPDFMTCDSSRPSWIGAANAIRLIDAYKTRPSNTSTTDPLERTVVSGTIAPGGTSAKFLPLYRVQTANPAVSAANGRYCLQFFSGGSLNGSSHCFAAGPAAEDAEIPFATNVAIPAGADRLALTSGGVELASIRRTANTPSFDFVSRPSSAPGRALSLNWTSTDADGDSLAFQVWASGDGGATWIPLALDLTAPSLAIDTRTLAPASSILVQIRSSDGFNEAIETIGPIELTAAPALDPIAPVRLSDSRWNEGRIVPIPLTNSGSGTLRVTAADSSSALFSYAGPEIVIPAGQSRTLPLLFTASEIGNVSASITIRTNDPARANVIVPVEGVVYLQPGPVASFTPAVLNFGAVSTSAERTVTVTNNGSATLNLTGISAGGTQTFRLTGANNASVAPGASLDIAVRCTPVSANYVAGTLTASTNDAARPSISVPMGCEGASLALEIPAATVDFGAVSSGQVRIQTVIVRNTSTQPINITGAVFTNSQFRLGNPRLPFTIPPASAVNLDLQFAPVVGGVATSTLNLTTDNPAISGLLNLRGVGTGSTEINGRLAVFPNQLPFGDIVINQSRTLVLTLNNTGTGQLTITALSPNNPVFAVSGVTLPLAIPAGGSVEAQIRFSPTSATLYNSVLTISSDSTSGSDVFLSLTGTGLPIPATTLSNLSAPLRQEWTARATLVSYGPDEANLRVVRFDNAGIQQNDTGLTIPAGAQLLPVIDEGTGWAQVRIARGSVDGFIQFSAQQGQTFDVIPFSPAIGTRLVMTGLERGSDILLNNLASEISTVALELRTNNGALLGSQTLTLSSRASIAQRVEQLFSAAPQGFQGYLTILASQPVQATRANNGGTAMEISPAQPAPAVATRRVILYAPRIRAGNGWLARLQIVNPTERDARVTIRAAAAGGGSVGTAIVETIPAGRAYWREFTQMFELDGNIAWNASLTVEADFSGLVAEVSYGNSFARAAYAFTDAPVRRSSIPVNTPTTTLYILNPNATPAVVSILNLLEGGTYGTGRRITIPAGAYYGGPSGLSASPALRLESDVPVVSQAALAADQVLDFGILPAVPLDGETPTTTPPGASPRLQVDPPSLDFGAVVLGQSRTLSLSIRNGGTAPLTVASILSDNARFAVEGLFPVTVLPGSTQLVAIRFTPATPAAIHSGALTVTSNDSLTGPVVINVNGSGTAIELPRVRIEVSPTSFDFGTVNSGQTKDLPLTIRNLGVDPLIVSGVTINNSRFQLVSSSFPLTIIPSGLATIQVRFSPSAAGAQTGVLTLASNDSVNTTLAVPLRGEGVGTAASPRIEVSVTSLEFGTVAVGQQDERTFEIRNTGVAPLIVQSMTLDNASYTVGPPAPFTLAPNAITDIGVIFRPKDPGNQPANLRIIANDPVNGSIVIPITGAGR
jgi:hypothetical protein